ncbi:MAG TPA: C40 family peptidase [Povalibacter sp.]
MGILRAGLAGMALMFPKKHRWRSSSVSAVLASVLLLPGCASSPPVSAPPIGEIGIPGTIETAPMPARQPGAGPSIGSEIVIRAISLLGAPYRFGSAGPKAFDCSGLVQFVHEEMGIDVPRTAAEQYRAAVPVRMGDIEPGDLLFFRISGKRISHVAIYAGSGRFVHAPQTGRPIEIRTLDDEFYRPRLAGAGRLF